MDRQSVSPVVDQQEESHHTRTRSRICIRSPPQDSTQVEIGARQERTSNGELQQRWASLHIASPWENITFRDMCSCICIT